MVGLLGISSGMPSQMVGWVFIVLLYGWKGCWCLGSTLLAFVLIHHMVVALAMCSCGFVLGFHFCFSRSDI